jgi:type I restriction enzyme S subunit
MARYREWNQYNLDEVFWFQEGPGVRKWQFTDSGIKLLNVANIEKNRTLNLSKTDRHLDLKEVEERYSHFLLDAGDLVIASSGISFDDDGMLRTRGAFVEEHHLPLCLNTSTIRFKAKPEVSDLGYLRHWLDSREFREQITKRVTGSAQQNFGPSHLKAIKITLPSLPEQRRIAAILDQADALRAKRREALAQLNSLTQSIFIEMFGDPVINPKKWLFKKVGNLLAFQQYGPRFYNESYSEKGTPIIRITDLAEDGSLDFSSMPKLSVSHEDIEKYALKAGDIIFARTGATVGKIALIQNNMPLCIAGAYFITMRFIESIVPIYAKYVLTSQSIREIVQKRSRQAAQQNFSGPGLRDLPMPMPPIHLQREFAHRVESIERLKEIQRASLIELDALFVSLQHRAFRGEL